VEQLLEEEVHDVHTEDAYHAVVADHSCLEWVGVLDQVVVQDAFAVEVHGHSSSFLDVEEEVPDAVVVAGLVHEPVEEECHSEQDSQKETGSEAPT